MHHSDRVTGKEDTSEVTVVVVVVTPVQTRLLLT